jgi:hypothetical protein
MTEIQSVLSVTGKSYTLLIGDDSDTLKNVIEINRDNKTRTGDCHLLNKITFSIVLIMLITHWILYDIQLHTAN